MDQVTERVCPCSKVLGLKLLVELDSPLETFYHAGGGIVDETRCMPVFGNKLKEVPRLCFCLLCLL